MIKMPESRRDQNKDLAPYKGHGISIMEITAAEVEAALEKNKTITLATCAENRVTIRPMSHINDGLTVYFQTGEFYLKTQQIEANPYVAFDVGTYQIEGNATILGHPMDEKITFLSKN
jgi:nitroimidazol reductase NimA-like FMN-containing flavoprotein (pyridoxamine 5'-phosphate oxidase superfamily)